ncbi:MAG: hypothetical protein MI919_30785 [Holophagales bacterium]|nr:hypothetical protein [Holophagales bacterium]
MANAKRYIGLSLGADLDWPLCFEEILRRLDLRIPYGGETVEVAAERVTIEPFDLQQPCKYQVVLDRLTHWYHTSREWIKKAVILDDLYVLNNPWAVQSVEKHTSYCAMMRLGLPVPHTWLVPPKAYAGHDDLRVTLERYAQLFDVGSIGDTIGYPLFIKPYDGGGWRGVSKIENAHELQVAYEQSGTLVMHLQQSVDDYDLFVRTIGVGPQVLAVRYDPGAPLHDRYKVDFGFLEPGQGKILTQQMLTINSFFGWDFNSCESLRKDGRFHPIDFANACPDSQVTSLHFHFPALVKALLRWSIFCAVTRRKMRQSLDWEPFYAIAAEKESSLEDRLERYSAIAHERFETEKFREFCAEHLDHLDEVAWEYFGSDHARDAVAAKVKVLFPEHEHERFTEHFWGLIQFWRKTESGRTGQPDTTG